MPVVHELYSTYLLYLATPPCDTYILVMLYTALLQCYEHKLFLVPPFHITPTFAKGVYSRSLNESA